MYSNETFMWALLFFTVFTTTINKSDEIKIEQMNIQLLGKRVLQMIKNNMTEDNIFQKSKLILLKNSNFHVLHNYFRNNFTDNCLWQNQIATLKNNLKLLEFKYHKIEKCFDNFECFPKTIIMNLKSLCMFVKQKIYHEFRNISRVSNKQ